MSDLIEKAMEAFNALSSEQQAEMLEETRKSFAENNVALSRPATPVEGLETELWATYAQDGRMIYTTANTPESGVTEYVTRSQAEAIIAAERAATKLWFDREREAIDRAKALEAKLAAAERALQNAADDFYLIHTRISEGQVDRAVGTARAGEKATVKALGGKPS